jgi:hypothetical protein
VTLQATDLVGPFQPMPEVVQHRKPPRVRKPSEAPMFVPAVDHGDAVLALGGFAEMLIASRAIFSTSENP